MVWSQLNTGAKIIKTFQHCYSTNGAQPPSELSPSQMLLLSLSLQPWAGLGGSRKVEAQELWHWALWLMDKGVDDLFILVPHQSGAQLLRNDPHRDRQQWAASVLLQGNLFNNLEQELQLFLSGNDSWTMDTQCSCHRAECVKRQRVAVPDPPSLHIHPHPSLQSSFWEKASKKAFQRSTQQQVWYCCQGSPGNEILFI